MVLSSMCSKPCFQTLWNLSSTLTATSIRITKENPMRFSIEQKYNIGFGLLLLILGAVGTISYRNIVASAKAQRGMSRTYETQEQIRQVQLDFKRVEVGQRSYLVTQADGDLFSYRTAVTQLGYDVDFLRSATAESPAQQERLSSLDYLLTLWVAILQRTMAS